MRNPTIFKVLAASLLLVQGCGFTPQEQDPLDGWVLAWSDEFDGDAGASPNEAFWTYDIGGNGWGNNQLEYNSDRPENVSLDGQGNLVITARRENFQGNQYTSARITTQGRVTTTYGRIEARMSLPIGQGIWPAFWMLGENIETVGWPQCGELDIMEYLGDDPGIVFGTAHGPGYSGGLSIGEEVAVSGGAGIQHAPEPASGETKFRVYTIEWEEDEVRWYVDDVLYHTLTPEDVPPGGRWVYDQPFFLILNVAVGGLLPGDPDETTQFPQAMLVDYVRIYERQAQ